MSPRLKISWTAIALLIFNLACATFFSGPSARVVVTESPTSAPATVVPSATAIPATATSTATPTLAAPVACPVITDKVMEHALLESDHDEELLDEEIYLITYAVSGDEISDAYYADADLSADLQHERDDTETHRQIWNYFAALIPAERRGVIGEYAIMTDGKDGGLAAVAQTQDDPNVWALEVDIADSRDYYNLTFTLVHEFGHLLTLGPDQVPPSLAVFDHPDDNDIYLDEVSKCPQYFPGEGCANADSYINAYYERFWTDIYEEWNAINLEEDTDAYYARLDDFYYQHEDQFLTDYAATNPEEDIAETWAFFVLDAKPAGTTIAEEKILFFYQYPELVELREEILGNVCGAFPE